MCMRPESYLGLCITHTLGGRGGGIEMQSTAIIEFNQSYIRRENN